MKHNHNHLYIDSDGNIWIRKNVITIKSRQRGLTTMAAALDKYAESVFGLTRKGK